MEKKRTYKSKSGGVYELVQVKAPEKKKKKSSAGKVKLEKDGTVTVKRKDGLETYGSMDEYKRSKKKAAPKKAPKPQKMAGRARTVKRARNSSRKRKPGQMKLL